MVTPSSRATPLSGVGRPPRNGTAIRPICQRDQLNLVYDRLRLDYLDDAIGGKRRQDDDFCRPRTEEAQDSAFVTNGRAMKRFFFQLTSSLRLHQRRQKLAVGRPPSHAIGQVGAAAIYRRVVVRKRSIASRNSGLGLRSRAVSRCARASGRRPGIPARTAPKP